MWIDSLRGKITLGYYAVGTLIVALAMFSLLELGWFEARLRASEAVSELFDTALEIRRFEKNYFLYHQEADLRENQLYVARALSLLGDTGDARADAAGATTQVSAPTAATLQQHLLAYQRLMASYASTAKDADVAQTQTRQGEVRAAGKDITASAEQITQAQRLQLHARLDWQRRGLIASIAALTLLVILVGRALSTMVATPLQEMEQSMEAVADGKVGKLLMHPRDREIVSLTRAFNHVLAELQLRKKHMVRSEKLAALGTMLSGVAHELNNPLSNISSSTQILLEEDDSAHSAFHRELLQQIDEQTQRARNIVRTLLDFARDRAFHIEPVPLRPLLEESIRFLRGQVPGSVDIALEVNDALVVSADRQRLQQVFVNLIKNAVEATEGGGTVRISATPYVQVSGARGTDRFDGHCGGLAGVDIAISDQGAGIAADALPHIFDPFFTTKAVGKGSGLGLFVVYEILEEAGGCIAVDSQPGVGTTFYVRLPQRKAEPAARLRES